MVLTYKMDMYVPPYVKKKGAYGADKTEKWLLSELKEW